MQVKGGKQVTLTPGQTFYEGPEDVHVVGRNASSTQPAKLLVFMVKDKGAQSGLGQGAYVLADSPGGNPEVILIASGSEVSLAVQAHEKLLSEGIRSRVVSLPSWEIFDHQTQEYQDSVLPPNVRARVAVEQACTFGWERYVGTSGHVIGMKTFGASAPLKELQRKFGFQPDQVVAAAKKQLGRG
jgi:transketolase